MEILRALIRLTNSCTGRGKTARHAGEHVVIAGKEDERGLETITCIHPG
jgi:hypothetical protein